MQPRNVGNIIQRTHRGDSMRATVNIIMAKGHFLELLPALKYLLYFSTHLCSPLYP